MNNKLYQISIKDAKDASKQFTFYVTFGGLLDMFSAESMIGKVEDAKTGETYSVRDKVLGALKIDASSIDSIVLT